MAAELSPKDHDAATQALLAARQRPRRPHVMLQRWEKLAFLHWRWDPGEIQRALPPGLTVDTFDGDAWLAIVPFYMRAIRPRFLPPVPGISDFLELNVRTYARDDRGRHGVWFYSLDCDQPLAVRTARRFFRLPYQHAQMSATETADEVVYHCQREGGPPARFRYHLHPDPTPAKPGTLEFFLAERYLLFAAGPTGLRCGQVHHAPYPLVRAEVAEWDVAPILQAGFQDPQRPPDHVIGSPGVQVRVYALTP